jgi:hypothetical protein
MEQLTGELSATLGGAYESFLKARLERRAGGRGKVQARAAKDFLRYVAEDIDKAGVGCDQADALWVRAIAELDRDRGEIEADVLAHHGFVVPEHEWGAFVEWVGRVAGSGR